MSLLHDDNTVNACAVMDRGREILADPQITINETVFSLIHHEMTQHYDPPQELTARERELIGLSAALVYAVHDAMAELDEIQGSADTD